MPELKTVNVYSNYRVVVPVGLDYLGRIRNTTQEGRDAAVGEAKGVIADIRRHVDGGEHAHFDCDVQVVCTYCGAEMSGAVLLVAEQDLPAGAPVCCGKAQDEWLEAWQEEEEEG